MIFRRGHYLAIATILGKRRHEVGAMIAGYAKGSELQLFWLERSNELDAIYSAMIEAFKQDRPDFDEARFQEAMRDVR